MNSLPELTTEQCWSLLGDYDVGRVAFTENALPTIVPVSYTLVGNRLVLRCRSERMAAHLDGQVIAFEVDDGGAVRAGSRSVVVTGTAERLGQPGSVRPDANRASVRLSVGQVRGFVLDLVA